MFADNYLAKNNRVPLINTLPDKNCGMIVVIPCLREPDLLQTLNSLKNCYKPACKVEVIILINHAENADKETRFINQQTWRETVLWIEKNYTCGISFYVIGPIELRKKWAGAGLARKIGMDEALLRFNKTENPEGIVISLDADTIVDRNYLVEIEKYFDQNPLAVGATLDFEHQKNDLDEKHLQGIILYEKYLWYYKNALQFAGFPHSMYTIGSAFAVKAGAYVKRGGMNRRQAGEDFYFLQNLVQIGYVGEIKTTKVYPSARISNRVPFGTGPVLQKWMDGIDDISITYNFQAFIDLKKFFSKTDCLFKVTPDDYSLSLDTLPLSIKSYLNNEKFWDEIADLNSNCSSMQTFQNRFFHKFNAFKVLKFLNFAHGKYYKKADLISQISLLNRYNSNS